MDSIMNYYDKLDLKYPEIAIAMDDIDRIDPKPTRFIIPILTPNLNNSVISEKKIYQNKSNLQNSSSNILEINDISVSNYITIPVPKEVCGGLEADLYKLATFIYSSTCTDSGEEHCTHTAKERSIYSFISDDIRYIKKGSKWIVVFVGGDITNPRIIARYE